MGNMNFLKHRLSVIFLHYTVALALTCVITYTPTFKPTHQRFKTPRQLDKTYTPLNIHKHKKDTQVHTLIHTHTHRQLHILSNIAARTLAETTTVTLTNIPTNTHVHARTPTHLRSFTLALTQNSAFTRTDIYTGARSWNQTWPCRY